MAGSRHHSPTCLPSAKNTNIQWTRRSAGPRAHLAILEKKFYLVSAGIQTPDILAQSLVAVPEFENC